MTVPNMDPELVAYVKSLADQVPSPDEASATTMTPERRELLDRLLEPTPHQDDATPEPEHEQDQEADS